MIKRIELCLITAAILFAALLVPVFATDDTPDTTLAGSVCVYNTDASLAVFTKNADMQTMPAATAKIMTAILAFEHFADDTQKMITVSEEAVKISKGNKIGFLPGEEVSVQTLLTALISGGANDAANIFALTISGSIDAFCEKMNQKARELGAVNTVYKNPCGLDEEGMTTTAYDVALISEYAYKLPGFVEYSMIDRYFIPETNLSAKRECYNRNHLVSIWIQNKYYNKNAIGLNAGSTELGGACTVSAVEKEGLTYIIVVMNAKEDENGDNSSYYIASDLINWAPDNFGYKTVLDPSNLLIEIPVNLGRKADYVIASPKTKAEYFLSNSVDIKNDISYKTSVTEKTLTAPVYEGQTVGYVDVIYENKTIATVDLVAKNNVNASTWLKLLDYIKNLLKSRQVKIAIVVFVLLFISYLLLSYMHFVRTHKNKRK